MYKIINNAKLKNKLIVKTTINNAISGKAIIGPLLSTISPFKATNDAVLSLISIEFKIGDTNKYWKFNAILNNGSYKPIKVAAINVFKVLS